MFLNINAHDVPFSHAIYLISTSYSYVKILGAFYAVLNIHIH